MRAAIVAAACVTAASAGVQCSRADAPPIVPANTPSGETTPRPAVTPAAAIRQAAIRAAMERSSLLTPETAAAIADAQQRRGLAADALEEVALVLAIQGFTTLSRDETQAVGSSFDRMYAALADGDRADAAGALAAIREARGQAGDVTRAVSLMSRGTTKMDESSRRRFQQQYSSAIAVALAIRGEQERQAAAGPPANTIPPLPSRAAAAPHDAITGRVVNAAPEAAALRVSTASPSQLGSAGSQGQERTGRGEEYWRSRAARLRADVASAQQAVASAESELRGALLRETAPNCPPLPLIMSKENVEKWKCYVSDTVSRARAQLGSAQGRLAAAKRALDALDDDARRDGALPGWIR